MSGRFVSKLFVEVIRAAVDLDDGEAKGYRSGSRWNLQATISLRCFNKEYRR